MTVCYRRGRGGVLHGPSGLPSPICFGLGELLTRHGRGAGRSALCGRRLRSVYTCSASLSMRHGGLLLGGVGRGLGTVSGRVSDCVRRSTGVDGGCGLLASVPNVNHVVTLRAVMLARGFATVDGPHGCTYCVKVTPFGGRSNASMEGGAKISGGNFSRTGTSLSVTILSTVGGGPSVESC